MFRFLVCAMFLANASFAPAVAAPSAQVLEPTGPWNIDYSDDSCALRRSFANPDGKVLFEMRQFAPGDDFNLTIASRDFRFGRKSPVVRFTPSGKPWKVERVRSLIYSSDLEAIDWTDSFFDDHGPQPKHGRNEVSPVRTAAAYREREAGVDGLEIADVFAPPIHLDTGRMDKPMDAMRQCLDELVTHWGVDAAAHRKLTRRAHSKDQDQWARKIQANYPFSLLEKRKSGIVRIRMMVGADGRPTECHLQMPTQDKLFETTACREMMKAARFEPALDAAGQPIASFYTTSIIYLVN